jgi:hypothetical protein
MDDKQVFTVKSTAMPLRRIENFPKQATPTSMPRKEGT